MSYLNITRNIFLEKEELNRFQLFLQENLSQKLFFNNTRDFGIVTTDFVSETDFQIQAGTNAGTLKLLNESFALDSDGLLITQKPFDNLVVPDDSSWYWVKISHKYDPAEVGTVSIDADGRVMGIGTIFSEVIRGQSTEVPVKIKFVSTGTLLNDLEYEVVDIIDDQNLILTGASFTAESNLKYVVVGSTPISEFLTSLQKTGLYQYDACNMQLISEEYADTPPTINFVTDKQFYLARVSNTAGVVTIQDKRTNWWFFNIPGFEDKLDKNLNLSDLMDLAAARNNLGVYSKAEVDAATSKVNSHAQALGSNLATATGSKVDLSGMTLTLTPKGSNLMVMFSALLHTSVTTQSVTVYLIKDGADVKAYKSTIYQWDLNVAFQYLIPVTKGVQTTIKIAWNGTTNITQNGVESPRVLSIIDLP